MSGGAGVETTPFSDRLQPPLQVHLPPTRGRHCAGTTGQGRSDAADCVRHQEGIMKTNAQCYVVVTYLYVWKIIFFNSSNKSFKRSKIFFRSACEIITFKCPPKLSKINSRPIND